MDRQIFISLIEDSVPPRIRSTKTKGELLNHEQASRFIEENGYIYSTCKRLDDGTSVFFVPNWYTLGFTHYPINATEQMAKSPELRILNNKWVPSDTLIPHCVKPRVGLETGIIETFDHYVFVYHRNDRYIQSIDELYNYLYLKEVA